MDDRAEAIDILTRMSTNHFYGHREQEALKLGAEALGQRWIPVTERLPEEGVTVLATFKGQGGNFCLTTSRLIIDGYESWSAACGLSPIAWMPLPESYKGGEQE